VFEGVGAEFGAGHGVEVGGGHRPLRERTTALFWHR
jgi:hypothetical protein